MSSVAQSLGGRTVGTIEAVSANSITVLLDPEAPHATAINTGSPAGFPRINGYLLVPNEAGATVGVITRVEVERLPYPKRKGMQDFGLVDLPFPARMVTLTPVGTLHVRRASRPEVRFEVRRGVDVFPSVGDQVLLPTASQLAAIVEGEPDETAGRVHLGSCPTAAGARVFVDPDKLFGRHLAVLGNTGAGKSCSVAGLVRWSLDAARHERAEKKVEGVPNARFIVLDPNGEYAKAFSDLNPRVFQVEPGAGGTELKVPAWLWNGEEWTAFTGAAPGVQRPLLLEAIRRLRSGIASPDPSEARVRQSVTGFRTRLAYIITSNGYSGFPGREDCADVLNNLHGALAKATQDCSSEPLLDQLTEIAALSREIETQARSYVDRDGVQRHKDIPLDRLWELEGALTQAAQLLGIVDDEDLVGEDTPRPFPVSQLSDCLSALASGASNRDLAQFVDTLKLRVRALQAPGALRSILDSTETTTITLVEWLTDYVGANQATNGTVAIVDLSLVPSDVTHVVVAVLARVIFEAVQRHRRETASELPTVLVLEEAHTFVHRDLGSDDASAAGRLCCRTFEKIAREGRKFGLGLVLASQRPSEMSPTVLSQCNTFLLHRLVNDRDQDLVRRLVPDALGDLLRELPSLPSRRAILLGWGAPAPVLVDVRDVPIEHRPHAPDPSFWATWTGSRPCHIDWQKVTERWTGMKPMGSRNG